MPTFTPIDHDAFVAAIRTLAAAVAASGDHPDFIVGIGRGGLTPAVYLSHAIGTPMLSIDTSTGVADFTDGLVAALAARTRDGERLLIVDDINDTGGTIRRLRAALAEAGAAMAAIRFAVLIDNVESAERIDMAARSIRRSVTKDWFVFPWEAVASPDAIAHDAAEVPERIA